MALTWSPHPIVGRSSPSRIRRTISAWRRSGSPLPRAWSWSSTPGSPSVTGCEMETATGCPTACPMAARWRGDRPAGVRPRPRARVERAASGTAWRRDSSQRGHRAVTVDLRGHGRSSKPDGPYDVPTVADDVAALHRRRWAWTGRSSRASPGAATSSLELAARHPRRGPRHRLRGRWLAGAERRVRELGGLPGGARAAAPRRAAPRRHRAPHPCRAPGLAGDRDRRHARQLRGPRRRHDRAVAHVRAPHRRAARALGPPPLASAMRAVAVPVLLAAGRTGAPTEPARQKRHGVDLAARGPPERPRPLVHGRPRHPRAASGRTRGRDDRPGSRRASSRERRPASSRSWAPARPRPPWRRSTAPCSSGSATGRARRRSSTPRTASRRTPTSSRRARWSSSRRASGSPVEVASYRIAGRRRRHAVHGRRPDPRRRAT